MKAQKILLSLLLLGVWPACFAAIPQVGEVSLVIGEARITHPEGGNAQLVTRNTPIRPGDRVETSAGGHVHIHFIDGGLISVRPDSLLVIESYQREEGNKQGTAIKFRLDRGAVRSVTGTWGEESRERFRLNTPIAAIGVRGTDFVVQANNEELRAAVVSGAIVVAPFGEECKAELLGPCSSQHAATLTANMGNVMLELHQREATPRIVPLSDLKISAVTTTPVVRTEDSNRLRPTANTQDSVTETSAGHILSSNPVTSPVTTPTPTSTITWNPNLLVWGRWASVARTGDTMTVSQTEARDSGNRQIATGSVDSYYLLYRSDGYNANFPASLGSTSFSYHSGQASLGIGDATSLVNILGGDLNINFASSRFTTTLNMQQLQLGTFTMSAAGSVSSSGILLYRGDDGSYVTGALATNGAQAAYAFGTQTSLGLVSGIANWGISK